MAKPSILAASSRSRVEIAALQTQQLLGKFASAFLGLGLTIFLGFDPLPAGGPIQAFWADNRVATLLLLVIIAVIGIASYLITRRRRKRPRTTVKNHVVRLLCTLSDSIIEIVIGCLAGLLLGIGNAPSTIPVLALIRNRPPIGIGLGAILLLVLILAPLLTSSPDESDEAEQPPEKSRVHTRLWLATSTSLVTTALLFSLIGLITIRPSWCPTSICPAPQYIVVTNPHGINDGVMESYYLAQQGDAFVMTQDPATYTFSTLPGSINAVELGGAAQPYRAVIGIHSLQWNTRYGLIIDGVDVLLDQETPIIGPVNVYLAGASLSYDHNVSNFIYNDQAVHSNWPAKLPASTIGLEVGGSDELAIQVTSQVEVYLQFRLEVHYHQIVGGPLSRTLIVPHEFGVYFLAPAHWHPYTFSGGKMTPQG